MKSASRWFHYTDLQFRCGNLKEGDHLEGLDIDGRVLLKWILKKYEGWHGLDLSSSGEG
jgi:hypothetical protein